jgi:hypothetical protein
MTLTTEQFNKLVTKEYFKEELERELEKKLGETKNEILGAIDGLAKAVRDTQDEQTASLGARDRFQGILDNHETRIKKLEIKAA